jgi:hypothetical protein
MINKSIFKLHCKASELPNTDYDPQLVFAKNSGMPKAYDGDKMSSYFVTSNTINCFIRKTIWDERKTRHI